jgi:hypothetical protein
LESLADSLIAELHTPGADSAAAVAKFCNAFAGYKQAVHQEEKAASPDSIVRTWVCWCPLQEGKQEEVARLGPERMKYLAGNGEHVRLAGALVRKQFTQPEVLLPLLPLSPPPSLPLSRSLSPSPSLSASPLLRVLIQGGDEQVIKYVLHMSLDDAREFVTNEPLNKAGCYESAYLYEMQQHWSNIAA